MKPSLRTKLDPARDAAATSSTACSPPRTSTRDLDRYRALSREHAEITPVVALYRDWQKADARLAAAQEMLADPK